MTHQTSTIPTEDTAPPPPPRLITPRALRRSWHERPVRLWMLLTIIITLSTLSFAIRDISSGINERNLIEHGLKVPATIDMVDLYERKNRTFSREEAHNIRVRYTTPAGRAMKADIVYPASTAKERFMVGDTIELRMDRDDPESITLQTQPRSWTATLSVVILLTPLAILLAVVMLLQRRRVLRVWQTGDAAEAVAVDSHRSGIAPRSKVVRFTLEGADDRRVFSTLYPHEAGELHPGDVFWIVMRKDSPGQAVVAELYE